jgi:tRNA1Val (adenine37-N6)-methyltransferase
VTAPSGPGGRLDEAAGQRRGHGVRVADDETLDAIGPYSFIQKRRGARLTADSVLLSGFVPPLGPGETVIDLGAGAGALLLLLSSKTDAASITGIEVQEGLYALAQRNIEANGLSGRVSVVNMDLKGSSGVYPEGSFSVVVSNPPYTRLGCARVSPLYERGAARGELMAGLKDFIAASRHLTGRDGRAFFVFPASRLDDMLSALRQGGLRPRRLRFVHPGPGLPARIFLIEAGVKGELSVEAPVFG